jgi:hypothetical protein
MTSTSKTSGPQAPSTQLELVPMEPRKTPKHPDDHRRAGMLQTGEQIWRDGFVKNGAKQG